MHAVRSGFEGLKIWVLFDPGKQDKKLEIIHRIEAATQQELVFPVKHELKGQLVLPADLVDAGKALGVGGFGKHGGNIPAPVYKK
jgi:hypothetical protein